MMRYTPEMILQEILPVSECADMKLVTRIRQIISQNMIDIAQRLMQEYVFWYDNLITPSVGLVFWSENHYIMNCSSELLLREMLHLDIPPTLLQRIMTFLDVKIYFGTSEWLSPVYLPFTITSLLNLFDFTKIQAVRDQCKVLLDKIATEVLSVTSPIDGGIVSPSGRAYSRHRVKTKGLHLNVFLDFLLLGDNIPEPMNEPEQALRVAVSTTTYRPSPDVFTYFNASTMIGGKAYIRLSSPLDDVIHYLASNNVDMDIYVSILWTYGIYIPPDYENIKKVATFMDTYNLWKHPHFKALGGFRKYLCGRGTACLSRFINAITSCTIANDFLKGARLTDAVLHVYKEGTIVVSSLTNYNTGLPAFQQCPFAINLNGVPLWCGFGSVGTGGLCCLGNKEAGKELSTARLFPRIVHTENRIILLYSSTSLWMKLSTLQLRPQMYWPIEQFDEHGKYGGWSWARKGTAIVAYRIRKSLVEIAVRDTTTQSDISTQRFLESL